MNFYFSYLCKALRTGLDKRYISSYYYHYYYCYYYYHYYYCYYYYHYYHYYYYYSSKNYLYAIQVKGTQGAKAWPVLRLVRLELKGSVQLTSKVKICMCIYIIS